ncbi:MAG: TolC family protein [Pseudomonadota bacterium]
MNVLHTAIAPLQFMQSAMRSGTRYRNQMKRHTSIPAISTRGCRTTRSALACFFCSALLAFAQTTVASEPEASWPAPGTDAESIRAWLLRENPRLKAMLAEAKAAEARVFPAGSLPDPMLQVTLRDIPVETATFLPGNAGTTLYEFRQRLPLWGKRELARSAARAEADSMLLQRDAEALELLAEAEAAYVRYWHADATLRVIDRLIGLLQQVEEIAGVRYALGMAAQQDSIRAQVERSSMQRDRIRLQTARREAVSLLNALLGRHAEAELAMPRNAPSLPVAVVDVESALDRLDRGEHPSIAAGMAFASMASRNKALQMRNRYPDITVGVAPMQRGGRLDGYELMLEIEIPLQQRARRERERESSLLEDAAISRTEDVRVQLQGRLAAFMSRWRNASVERRLIERTLLPQAEANYRSALASYQVGEVDFGTLLDALREWQGADRDLIDATREELESAAMLRGLQGGFR